jgi:hypothetical protein
LQPASTTGAGQTLCMEACRPHPLRAKVLRFIGHDPGEFRVGWPEIPQDLEQRFDLALNKSTWQQATPSLRALSSLGNSLAESSERCWRA